MCNLPRPLFLFAPIAEITDERFCSEQQGEMRLNVIHIWRVTVQHPQFLLGRMEQDLDVPSLQPGDQHFLGRIMAVADQEIRALYTSTCSCSSSGALGSTSRSELVCGLSALTRLPTTAAMGVYFIFVTRFPVRFTDSTGIQVKELSRIPQFVQ